MYKIRKKLNYSDYSFENTIYLIIFLIFARKIGFVYNYKINL
jgi:hypothetical protein